MSHDGQDGAPLRRQGEDNPAFDVISDTGDVEDELEDGQALGADEYAQKERHRQLLNAREKAQQAKVELELAAADPYVGVTEWDALLAYHSIVSAFIEEVEALMTIHYPETGEGRWDRVELGVVEMEPPTELVSDSGVGSVWEKSTRVIEPATIGRREFVGLRSVVASESPLEFAFSATVDVGAGSPETRTESIVQPIPWQILNDARRQVNLFLAEIGLDLDPEEEAEHGKT